MLRKYRKQQQQQKLKSLYGDDLINSASYIALCSSGIDQTADLIGYEPVQRIMAVSTQDGRLKLIGKLGVELTLQSENRVGSIQLKFWKNRGVLLRITKDGALEIWCLQTGILVTSLASEDDPYIAVTPMGREPYLILLSYSGALQFVKLRQSLDCPEQVAQASVGLTADDLELLPHYIEGDHIGVESAKSIEVHQVGDEWLALITGCGTIAVWNISKQLRIASLPLGDDGNNEQAPSSHIICATWFISPDKTIYILTGHEDGTLAAWQVNSLGIIDDISFMFTLQGTPTKKDCVIGCVQGMHMLTCNQSTCKVLSLQDVSISGVQGSAGLAIWSVPATLFNTASQDTVVESQVDCSVDILPWFGTIYSYTPIVQPGALTSSETDAMGIVVLAEGGQIIVHQLNNAEGKGTQDCFRLPLQATPSVSSTALVSIDTFANFNDQNNGLDINSTTYGTRTMFMSILSNGVSQSYQAKQSEWGWMLSGGNLQYITNSQGVNINNVYFTGHLSGEVNVWTIATTQPQHVLTIPPIPIPTTTTTPPRKVTLLQSFQNASLVIVGHERGELRVYRFGSVPEAEQETVHVQYSNNSQSSDHFNLSDQLAANVSMMYCFDVHTATVNSVSYGAELGVLIAGDQAGYVSVTDLSSGRVLSYRQLFMDQAIHSVRLVQVMPSDTMPSGSNSGAPTPVGSAIIDTASLAMTALGVGGENNSPKKRGQSPKSNTTGVVNGMSDMEVACHCQWGIVVATELSTIGVININSQQLLYSDIWLVPKLRSPVVACQALDVQFGIIQYDDGPSNGETNAESNTQYSAEKEVLAVFDEKLECSVLSEKQVASSDGKQPCSSTSNDGTQAGCSSSAHQDGNQAGCSSSVQQEGEQAKQDSSDAVAGGNCSTHSGSHDRSSSGEDEYDSEDDDELLQAAVDAMHKKRRKRGKIKRFADKMNINRWADKKSSEDETGSQTPLPEVTSPTVPDLTAASVQDTPIGLGPIKTKQVGTIEVQQPPTPGSPGFYDIQLAEVVVIVCQHVIRLYKMDNVAWADKAVLQKVEVEATIVAGSVVKLPQGPAIAVVTADNKLQVYAMPSLSLLCDTPLEHIAHSQFTLLPQNKTSTSSPSHNHNIAIAQNGVMSLLGTDQQLVTLEVTSQTASQPASPTQHTKTEPNLIDWDMIAASISAAYAADAAKTAALAAKQAENQPRRDIIGRAISRQFSGFGGAKSEESKSVSSPGSQLKDVLSRAFTTSSALSMPSIDETPAAVMSPTVASPATSSPRRQANDRGQGDDNDHATRSALGLGANTKPRARTAEEIKSQYRKDVQGGVGEVKNVMADNKARLEERIDRLKGIEEKAARMEQDAEGFAAMASKLAQQSNKKWWQF